MAGRRRTPSGTTIPASQVRLTDGLYRTLSGGWQVRWHLTAIKCSGTRSFNDVHTAREFQDRLRGALNNDLPFDTGTREPALWSADTTATTQRDDGSTERTSPSKLPAETLLDLARSLMSEDWDSLSPRSRDSLLQVWPIAIWAHVPAERRPRREWALAYLRSAIVPAQTPAEMEERLLALTPEQRKAGEQVRRHLPPAITLDQEDQISQVVRILDRKKDGEILHAHNVIRRKRAALHRLLAHGERRDILPRNPMHLVRKPKRRKTLKPISEREVISLAAGEALIALLAAHNRLRRWAAYFACMLLGGFRPGELDALDWTDLDLPEDGWGAATPHSSSGAVPSYANDGQSRTVGPLKWREPGEDREVPLHPTLVRWLLQHRDEFTSADPQGRYVGPVFRGPRGGHLGRSQRSEMFAWARDQILTDPDSHHWVPVKHPLRTLTPYGLRHHAATALLQAKIPANRVALRMGHSVQVLQTIYAGFLNDDTEQENDDIDAWYEEQRDS